jgi:hypothetical protein
MALIEAHENSIAPMFVNRPPLAQPCETGNSNTCDRENRDIVHLGGTLETKSSPARLFLPW